MPNKAVSVRRQAGDYLMTTHQERAMITEIEQRLTSMERSLCDRIDSHTKTVHDLALSVASLATQCGVCGKTVMGNGKPPLGERVSTAESKVATILPELESLWSARQADHDQIVKLVERDDTRVRFLGIGWKALSAIVGITGLVFTVIQVVFKLAT